DSGRGCCDRTLRVEDSPDDQYSYSERLADWPSDLSRRWHYVHLSLCYARNIAGGIWLPRRHWRRTNGNFCADRGVDSRATPAECCEVGDSLESFWHARSD